MPTSDDAFFDELKTWSEIKHRILAKYLRGYLNYRGGKNPRIYYVDGFAGTGRYGENDHREGSPVLIANLAQQVAAANKPYQLVCINTELRPDRFAQLQACLAPFPTELVQAYEGAFADHLPAILETTLGCPAVFFLDPFGPKAIRLAQLRTLLKRKDTELLLNLNTPYLRRMAGFEDSPDSREREAKIRLVGEVLGDDPMGAEPAWLRRWLELNDGALWEDWAAQTYMTRVLEESSVLKFVARYPVRETFRAHPKYWLVFATRAKEAIILMNDLVYMEDDQLFAKVNPAPVGQQTFFSVIDDAAQNQRLSALMEDVHRFGMAQQRCTRDDVFEHFVPERWGEFKRAHYRQAIAHLVEAGRARFTGERRRVKGDKDEEFLVFC